MRFWQSTAITAILAMAATSICAIAQNTGTLRIYYADVEGGQATLFVTPLGESLLVDTGYPGFNGRDSDRIVALCKHAGISRIDNVLITHYHNDHVGGVPELAAKIPIGRFIDHGPNRESDEPVTVKRWEAYQKVLADKKYARLSVKVGDVLPLKGMHAEIVSGDGKVLTRPLSAGGAGNPNPACAKSPLKPLEHTENDYSLGMLITFGSLRILDLGDLTWANERPLMCPVDMLGKVDIYIVSHHGMERSGSPALVDAIAPKVAIMENRSNKGDDPTVWEILQNSPRIADGKGALWQLHTGESPGAHNVPDDRIANLPGGNDGNSLELSASPDGSFTITNERTGKTIHYPSK